MILSIVDVLLQVGNVLLRNFDGEAANLVAAADGSAAKLVDLVVESFPGFRDSAPYRCNTSSYIAQIGLCQSKSSVGQQERMA